MNTNQNIDSIVLFLGPYRNLTTLTASLLFFHDNIQVLNHGSSEILNTNFDFIKNKSKKTFQNFINKSLELSKKKRGGDEGGSIIYSHAFSPIKYNLKKIFRSYYLKEFKDDIKCLIWKESHRITNHIIKNNLNLNEVLDIDSRINLVLPIRNPLDCVKSNMKTGHIKYFDQINNNTLESNLKNYFKIITWIFDQKENIKDNFFFFFEYESHEDLAKRILSFLRLDYSESYIKLFNENFLINKNYVHEKKELEVYYKVLENFEFKDNHIKECFKKFKF